MKRELLDMIRFDKGMPTLEFYEDFEVDEISAAKDLLAQEAAYLKSAINHPDLETSYPQVWGDVNQDVLYLPSKNRYGRLSLLTTKACRYFSLVSLSLT